MHSGNRGANVSLSGVPWFFLAICDRCCSERQKLRLLGHRPIQAEK
jgi:hypothetical protein